MMNGLFDDDLPVKLYSSAAFWLKAIKEAENFYGKIPHTLEDAVELGYRNLSEANAFVQPFSKKLEQALITWHKDRGLLTEKVRQNISRMKEGIVIAGQQTTIFGGVGLIANKICCTKALSTISEEKAEKDDSKNPLVPAFIVNDYDTVQPELTVAHFPNPSSEKGTPISLDLSHINDRAINIAERPTEDWFKDSLSTIDDLYTEFIHSVPKDRRAVFQNRLEELKSYLKITFFSATSLTDWVGRIWGLLMNVLLDLGIVFIPPSLPEIRSVKVKAFEYLLKHLDEFIAAENRAAETLEGLGLTPTLYRRSGDYVPFFLECPNDKYRLELTRNNQSNNQSVLEGKCPVCKTDYEIAVNHSNPDLTDWAQFLSPRVDSSQISYQAIAPIPIRVSGPGEISYYAMVAPAFEAIGIPRPTFVKYTRMFYNTPWNEALGKTIDEKGVKTIHCSDFFKLLGQWVKAKKRGNTEEFLKANRDLTTYLESFRNEDTVNPKVQRYLSWQFGKYTEEKFAQEVSWSWIDLAIAGGLREFAQTILRFYSENPPVGGAFFLNLY
ncbi:MAG: bacillithiol biosynthesis BshC [Candidatus Heimdallarchaeota archaeon]|nr:bacillithiol biosynthesis BshC [Candidatus Heimdallarchaeota archaeon]